MKIPKNLPEILFFIFGVTVGYIYGGFVGMLIGGGLGDSLDYSTKVES